jgi:hypothetical protein
VKAHDDCAVQKPPWGEELIGGPWLACGRPRGSAVGALEVDVNLLLTNWVGAEIGAKTPCCARALATQHQSHAAGVCQSERSDQRRGAYPTSHPHLFTQSSLSRAAPNDNL